MIKYIITAIVSAGVGSVATYFITRHIYENKMQDEMDKLLEEMSEADAASREKKPARRIALVNDISEKKPERNTATNEFGDIIPIPTGKDKDQAVSIIKKHNYAVGIPKEETVPDGPEDDDVETGAEVISEEDYETNEHNFKQEILTYYSQDGVLTNEYDEVLDIHNVIGGAEKELAKYVSTTGSMLVRNYDTSNDYEVYIIDQSFARYSGQ